MRYVMLEYAEPQEDEARQVYSELDRENLETRRVELYPNGLWFAYGDEHGREEALESHPLPRRRTGAECSRQSDGPDHRPRRVPGGLGPGGRAAGWFHGHVLLRSVIFSGPLPSTFGNPRSLRENSLWTLQHKTLPGSDAAGERRFSQEAVTRSGRT